MGENTYRHTLGLAGVREAAAPAANYWRRRLVVLTVGLTMLAAAAWSLSASLKVHAGAQSSASSRGASREHGASQPGSGSADGGSAGGGSAGASRLGSTTGAAYAGGWYHAGHWPGSPPVHSPASKPSATSSGFGGFKPPFCSWHSIVLSLSASQIQFGPGQKPNFSLSVVSTQPADCSFNVGVGHLALVIKNGSARIWSSADCVRGSGSLVTALKRGVPTVVSIVWNKKTSSPGCAGPEQSVPAGSYTACATDGSLVSAPVTVRLT